MVEAASPVAAIGVNTLIDAPVAVGLARKVSPVKLPVSFSVSTVVPLLLSTSVPGALPTPAV